MRFITKVAICGSILLTMLASASAQEFQFKLHHFNSPRSLAHQVFLVPWAKEIEAASNGRIKIDVYPSMQLGGKAEDLYSQVRDGVVDFAWTLQGYTAGQFPLTSVMELPFLTSSTEVASKALMALYERQYLNAEYSAVKVIALHTTDPNALHSIPAVKKKADLRGMKIRVASRWVGQTILALGATPVSMSLPEIAQAISRNQIDAFIIGWSVTRPFKLYESVKSHTEVALGASPAMFVMNKKAYESLPDDLKRIIDDHSGMKLSARLGKIWDEDVDKSRAAALQKGNEQQNLSANELAQWKAAVKPVIDSWISTNEKRGNSRKVYEDALELTGQHGAK